MNLKTLQTDPAIFRKVLRIDCDGLAKPLAEVMDSWQDVDFENLDAGWQRCIGQEAKGPSRAWLERPRGHSKTSDISTMVTWALFASKRKITGVVAACDRDQARIVRDSIDRIVRLNPWLGQLIKVSQWTVQNTRTGSQLEIISSDVSSSYGLLVDFIVCDELTIWPKRDLFDSILSSAAKKQNCLLLCIGNAGFGESWQWTIREQIRNDPSWYFSRLDGPKASWITRDRLAEQERLLPSIAFQRLWLNQWSSGSGDALLELDIKKAITLKQRPDGPEEGWAYFAGLDLGLRRDASAFIVLGLDLGYVEEKKTKRKPRSSVYEAMADIGLVDDPDEQYIEKIHGGSGKIRLIDCKIWEPSQSKQISITEVERYVQAVDHLYHLQCVAFDRWQCEMLAERLEAENVPCQAVDFVPNNLKSMATAVLESFQEGQIELFNDPKLLADLRALRVEERSYGIRLVPGQTELGTRHGDAATALAIALFAIRDKCSKSLLTAKTKNLIIA